MADARLAELLGTLSLACDVAYGFPLEKAMRSCVLAVELARRHGLTDEVVRDVFYTSLLQYAGCTAFAHEEAQLQGAGDDLALRNLVAGIELARPLHALPKLARGIAPRAKLATRARAIARVVADRSITLRHARSICDTSIHLAGVVGLSAGVQDALAQICERWDGRGAHETAGEALAIASRAAHIATFTEIAHHRGGRPAALAMARSRAGGHFDPALARTFVREADALFAAIEGPSIWERFLAAEPVPHARTARLDEIARGFAQLADLKSVWTLGHSTGVADLALAAARETGMPDDEQRTLMRAALLHDLGRVSAPNQIWDKAGPLTPPEWELVRMHAYWTERILSRTPLLRDVAQLACAAHERADGSGYHRGLSSTLGLGARLLAVADAYHAMREPRAYRPALDETTAAARVQEDVAAGRFDRTAAAAVLAAAGVAGRLPASPRPCGLTEREIEVLVLVARGHTNKQIAQVLGISPRTAQHHVIHIYGKIGVGSRAAAALFAIEHRLVDPLRRREM